MKPLMIRIGNFFFRTRNQAFPMIIVCLFLLVVPPPAVLEETVFESIKDIVAVLVAVSGLVIRGVVIGYAYIKRGGLNKQVYADKLVTEGMFTLSRNPLYVGNMLIYSGVFLMHGNPFIVVAGISVFWFIYQCIIYAEEAYLSQKFGEDYDTYCAEVPRWWPVISRFSEATKEMDFDMKRVVFKDYTTITNTIIMLAITEMYEYVALPDLRSNMAYIETLGAVIVLSFVAMFFVKRAKKKASKAAAAAK